MKRDAEKSRVKHFKHLRDSGWHFWNTAEFHSYLRDNSTRQVHDTFEQVAATNSLERVHFSKVSSERQAWRESGSIPSLSTGLSINRPRFTQSVDKRVRLTCGEMSAVGWVGRWRGWSGWASRDGTVSSSEPGSGCACTLDLWTTKSLCLCSARQQEKTKRRKLLLKNNDCSPKLNFSLSQDSYLPNHVHTQPSCIPKEDNTQRNEK